MLRYEASATDETGSSFLRMTAVFKKIETNSRAAAPDGIPNPALQKYKRTSVLILDSLPS